MSGEWGSYRAYYWPENRRVGVDYALSKRRGNKRSGDCWCHKDCYDNETGRRVFPRDYETSGKTNRRNHFWVGPGGWALGRTHPRRGLIPADGCVVSRRVKLLGEDTGSNNYYEHFFSDLKAELTGSSNMWDNIDTYCIQRVEFPKKNQHNSSDLIIHHTRGRNLTHVVIVNMSRNRIHNVYDENSGRTNLNTILIDIRQWTEDNVADFASHGKRKFKEEWDRLESRIRGNNKQIADAKEANRIAQENYRKKQRDLLLQGYFERLTILDDIDDDYLDGLSDDDFEQLFHQRLPEIEQAEGEAQRIAFVDEAELAAADAAEAEAEAVEAAKAVAEALEEHAATGDAAVDAYAAAEAAAEDAVAAAERAQEAAAATKAAEDPKQAGEAANQALEARAAARAAQRAARSASTKGASAAAAEERDRVRTAKTKMLNERAACTTRATKLFDKALGPGYSSRGGNDPWTHAEKYDLPRQNLEVCQKIYRTPQIKVKNWWNDAIPESSLWDEKWTESQKFNNAEELEGIVQAAEIELNEIITSHQKAVEEAKAAELAAEQNHKDAVRRGIELKEEYSDQCLEIKAVIDILDGYNEIYSKHHESVKKIAEISNRNLKIAEWVLAKIAIHERVSEIDFSDHLRKNKEKLTAIKNKISVHIENAKSISESVVKLRVYLNDLDQQFADARKDCRNARVVLHDVSESSSVTDYWMQDIPDRESDLKSKEEAVRSHDGLAKKAEEIQEWFDNEFGEPLKKNGDWYWSVRGQRREEYEEEIRELKKEAFEYCDPRKKGRIYKIFKEKGKRFGFLEFPISGFSTGFRNRGSEYHFWASECTDFEQLDVGCDVLFLLPPNERKTRKSSLPSVTKILHYVEIEGCNGKNCDSSVPPAKISFLRRSRGLDKDPSPLKPLSVGQKIKRKKQKKRAKKTPKQPTEELTGKNRPKKRKKGWRLPAKRGGPKKKD